MYSNKAQLRQLEDIRVNLLGSKKPLAAAALPSTNADTTGNHGKKGEKKTSIRPVLLAARFIARTRIAASKWATQEHVRLRLVAARDEQRRVKRSRHLRVVRVSPGSSP